MSERDLLRKFDDVLLLLTSFSLQSKRRISFDLLIPFVAIFPSTSSCIMLSSLKIPSPLHGPVPEQNFSSSKECVDKPVTSPIYDENVGERCEILLLFFGEESICLGCQSVHTSVLSYLELAVPIFSIFKGSSVVIVLACDMFVLPFLFFLFPFPPFCCDDRAVICLLS